jgi:hypothetical protein
VAVEEDLFAGLGIHGQERNAPVAILARLYAGLSR